MCLMSCSFPWLKTLTLILIYLGWWGATNFDPANASIIIEGTEVLQDLDVSRACALLGLVYALNLSYPKELKNTFEVFQKIILELDGLKARPKVMSLNNKLLYSWNVTCKSFVVHTHTEAVILTIFYMKVTVLYLFETLWRL